MLGLFVSRLATCRLQPRGSSGEERDDASSSRRRVAVRCGPHPARWPGPA